jgi:hypothetical protein
MANIRNVLTLCFRCNMQCMMLTLQVLDQLHFLEDFFMTMHAQGTPMVQLYERVQGDN